MIKIEKLKYKDKKQFYEMMDFQIKSIISEEKDWLANLCNISALLWNLVDDINWVGFYLYKNEELILGPFQGKPACTHIKIGEGVCGTSAKNKATILVEDVSKFDGHIACDFDTMSEIVLPLIFEDKIMGVLDIDSPKINRFDYDDKIGFEKIVNTICKYVYIPERY